MATQQIKYRLTGRVLFEKDCETMRMCVEAAVSARANLAGANLARANLAGAYLAGAKWRDGIVLTKAPLQISGLLWLVYVLENHMQIGCEIHTHAEWSAFTDRQIAAMDGTNAARFWKQNREWLLAACASHTVKADEAKAA